MAHRHALGLFGMSHIAHIQFGMIHVHFLRVDAGWGEHAHFHHLSHFLAVLRMFREGADAELVQREIRCNLQLLRALDLEAAR